MFARFTEPARRAVIHAGTLALDAGRGALGPEFLLLGLAETRPFALKSFTVTPEAVRGQIDAPDAKELLATIGIDLDAVHRRTREGTGDPRLWRLTRSRVRPLRIMLYGPLGAIPLAMHARKVVEVAMWKPGDVTGERLLWGLLADGSNGAARMLRAAGVDLPALVREAGVPVSRSA